MPWVTDHAPTRAELDACVTCGLCLPHCPTYRLTGDEAASPRGRLAAMAAVADGAAEVDRTFAEIMDFCLQCRACETACPSLVPFGRAMEGARAEVAAQGARRGGLVSRASVGAVKAPTLLRLTGWGGTVIAKTPLAGAGRILPKTRGLRPDAGRGESHRGRHWPAIGPRRGVAGLLTGCVMDAWFGGVHDATVTLLRRAGYDVDAPRDQTCCGALAAHDGAAPAAEAMAARNIDAFASHDLVVADAAGCSAHLKAYGHWGSGGDAFADRVRDVTEVIAELIESGVLPDLEPVGRTVAVQDPCHLRHGQRITDAPRRIVTAAGYRTVDLDPEGRCCGAAGLYTLVHPETAAALGNRKAAEAERAQVSLIASANPGCEMQLRAHVADTIRVMHPVELYAERLTSDVDHTGR